MKCNAATAAAAANLSQVLQKSKMQVKYNTITRTRLLSICYLLQFFNSLECLRIFFSMFYFMNKSKVIVKAIFAYNNKMKYFLQVSPMKA